VAVLDQHSGPSLHKAGLYTEAHKILAIMKIFVDTNL
jgi:hypothetical protein